PILILEQFLEIIKGLFMKSSTLLSITDVEGEATSCILKFNKVDKDSEEGFAAHEHDYESVENSSVDGVVPLQGATTSMAYQITGKSDILWATIC
ncbi:hypothetical protein ACJX0J_012524, partial [Zea mays]